MAEKTSDFIDSVLRSSKEDFESTIKKDTVPLTKKDLESLNKASMSSAEYRDILGYLKDTGTTYPSIRLDPQTEQSLYHPASNTIVLGLPAYEQAVNRKKPSTGVIHEMTHATQDPLTEQYAQATRWFADKPTDPEARRLFVQAYEKLRKDKAELARKLDPKWEKSERAYRSSPIELEAFGVGNVQGNAVRRGPLHLDPTMATEAMILLDLARRDARRNPIKKEDGGEVSTEEFIKKNVPRGTSEVPQLDPEGRLIDEREDIRSESQRMLNRLQSQPSKVPSGVRRAVAASKAQGKESMFPAAAPARDLLSGILGASPTARGSEAYRTGQAIANMPPVQAAAAIPAKVAASAGDAATALAAMGPAMGAVMKPKGGNWLAPSVERGLNYLIPRTGAGNRTAKETLEEMNRTYPAEELARMSPETRASVDRAYRWLEPNVAVQNWIEKKLTKYVKNEMATPEDPVRALAERGILHVDPEQLSSYPGAGNPRNQAVQRRYLGYPEEGLGRSEAAKRWEMASDYMIQTDRAQELLDPRNYGQGFVDQTLAANPWLTKVEPYERIYGVDTLNYRPDYSELGFDHLIDELKNSLNPDSGLPRALQLTPKQLDKVSVPQAVELVDKINKWRADQKAAADLKRSQNAATVEYKAYDTVPGTAESNKRGLRWVELRTPEITSADQLTPEAKARYEWYLTTGASKEASLRQAAKYDESLAESLKYEGEVMGHCVGGYCPDVEEGRSRIYSLRDAKGEPHVTIEVKPNPSLIRHNEIIDELRRTGFDLDSPNVASWDDKEYEAAYNAAQKALESRRPAVIAQIKGKANRAPKDEYLPFVQDFVLSGNWSNVQDLKNAGLTKIGNKYLTTEEYKSLVDPAMRYLERSPALEAHRRAQRELDAFKGDIPSPEYRELERRAGMQVHPDIPYTYREMRNIFRDPEAYLPESFGENLERVNLLRQLYGEEGFARGGEVIVPRETSTSKKQLDTLAQISQRKKA